MRDHVRAQGKRWVLQSASSLTRTGALVIAILAISGLAAMVLGFATMQRAGAVAGMIVGAVLEVLAVALLLATAGRSLVVDFATGHVGRGRTRVPLDAIDSLHLTYWNRSGARATARRDSGWQIELGGATLPAPVLALDCADELAAWRAAEQLARKLEVPMTDHAGDDSAVRDVAQLDQPLVEWVARQASLPAPPPPPESLTVVDTATRWRVEHPGAPWWAAVVSVAVLLSVTLAVVSIGAEEREGMLLATLLVAAAAVAGLGLIAWVGVFGRRALELDGDVLSTHGPFPRGTSSMPLATLERVRLTPGAVHFVSDDTILRLQIGGDERRWIRTALLHRLHATRAAAGPYR